jgi:DNA polymerase-3 subunit gamma/tau
MAGYLVLARKYRSNTFEEVVGQEPISQTLVNAITSGRIAHAYLFTGTRGVGKTTVARILAKALNCLSSDQPTAKPCNKCDACIAIGRGDDVDVVEIDGASNRGIDEIRELRANAIFRPARCRYKIYYIDEVHMLTKEAFNALLKTLEEPPEHVKFIFATTETEKVPATILSRCQRYDFRNIPTRKIADHLQSLCKAEGVQADDDAIFRIARAGAGSMRDSLSLLDQLIAAGGGAVTDADVVRVLGTPSDEQTLAIAQAIADGNCAAALGHLNGVLESGITLTTAATALGDIFRNLMLAQTCGQDSDLIELPETQRQNLAELAKKFTIPAVVQALGIVQSLLYKVRGSSVGRALVEAAIVRLAEADKFVDPVSLLERLESLGSGAGPRANQPAGAGQASQQARPAFRPAQQPAPSAYGQADLKKNSTGIVEPARSARPTVPNPPAGPIAMPVASPRATGLPATPATNQPTGQAVPSGPSSFPVAQTAVPACNHAFGNLSTSEKEEVMKDPSIREVLSLFGGEIADVVRIPAAMQEPPADE